MDVLVDGACLFGQRSGIGQYTAALLQALAQRQDLHRVAVAVGPHVFPAEALLEGEFPLPAPAAPANSVSWKRVIGRLVPFSRHVWHWWKEKRARRLTAGEWHVWHEPNYVGPSVNMPLVTTVHDLSYLQCPQFLPQDRLEWLQRRLPDCMRRSAAILTDSQFIRRAILEHFPRLDPDRVIAAPLGVDHDRFHPRVDADAWSALRSEFDLPDRFALYVGTLEPRKNLQGLLEAYARLPESMQREYPLVLAGMRGWREEHFRSILETLIRRRVVRSIGYLSDEQIPTLMRAASVFCFPSLYEGFGLPPLEAAACGTPVLCGNTASLPEVMGRAAVMVDPHDVDDIACGLERLLDDVSLREEMSLRGRRQALAFSWDRCAEVTVQAYRAAA